MKYRTIVADPPWAYEGFPTGVPPGRGRPHYVRNVPLPYASMTRQAICSLPVADMADTDCRLFLWTTNKYLPYALGTVLPDWGFEYRQTLVWHKLDSNPLAGSVAPNAEFLLVAIRGKPGVLTRMPNAVVAAAQTKRHSAKPECFMDYIEACSPSPRLEMFSRRARLGWDTWGAESLAGGVA
jgi:N6-adenosine-specific RNA methylase IME4